MFRKVANMYRDFKSEEAKAEPMIVLNILWGEQETKGSTGPESKYIPPHLIHMVHQKLQSIQPRDSQLWNCDQFGFWPNWNWYKVVCTYKIFAGLRMWISKTGERAPFCCNVLTFTIADGQFSMQPVVIYQASEYSQYFHLNNPMDLKVHHTPARYTDSNVRIK